MSSLLAKSPARTIEILEAEPQPALERILKLAARLFQAPVSFLSVKDLNGEWLQASYGKGFHEVARSSSFCAHAAQAKEPLVVCDASADERFSSNPLVTGEMKIHFYVGIALRNRRGLSLGSLSVMDTVSHAAPPQELLESFADLAFLATDNLEAYFATAAENDDTEVELRHSLREKETLLQEVHHRVKNNLQIVSSLLKLQADLLPDRSAAAILKESQQRVLSMALIHERLYADKHPSAIEFDSYAQSLVQELVNSYAGRAGTVTGQHLPPQILLSVGQAIPCGLILNELVTNALKYAYPDGSPGEVMVELHESPNGRIRIAVSDQGKGLPANFDFQNAPTLGLRICAVLARQLSGVLTVEKGLRTSFVLEFPRERPKVEVAA